MYIKRVAALMIVLAFPIANVYSLTFAYIIRVDESYIFTLHYYNNTDNYNGWNVRVEYSFLSSDVAFGEYGYDYTLDLPLIIHNGWVTVKFEMPAAYPQIEFVVYKGSSPFIPEEKSTENPIPADINYGTEIWHINGDDEVYYSNPFERPFTVTFNSNGERITTETMADGRVKGGLPAPSASENGKFFDGWYTEPYDRWIDAENGTRATDDTVFDSDTELYALWSLYGDANGDGVVDWRDAIALIQKNNGGNITINEPAGDIAGDGGKWLSVLKLIRHLNKVK